MENQNPGIRPTGGQTGATQPETFTKQRVSELMQRRVERSHRAFFNRYGVEDLKGLDDLFGKAKSVATLQQRIEELTKDGADLQSRYDELANRNKDLTKRYAFASLNVKPEMFGDIETYFKGKGLDIDDQTLSAEIKSHPDWVNRPGAVLPIGNESHDVGMPSEREMAGRLLGVDL